MSDDYTIVIRGDPAHADWALKAILEVRKEIDALDKIGWGWGIVNRRLGLSMFVRHTKSGISGRVSAAVLDPESTSLYGSGTPK